MTQELAILIPALGRPETIPLVSRSIRRTTSNVSIVFICTEGDNLVIDKVLNDPVARLIVTEPHEKGDYAKKINIGYEQTTEPVLFLGATDLVFHPNWYERAKAKLSKNIEVVGTNDLGNEDVLKGDHSTHTLVTRNYVDRYGTIDEVGKVLYEGYWHEYVDNEFVETARFRGKFAMALDSVVEHIHPMHGKAPWDRQYRDYRKRIGPSKDIYEDRRKMWMPQS